MKKFVTFEPLVFVAAIWIVFLVDSLLPVDFNHFGIIPRNITGLVGIVFSPFLHANLFHIISNSVPLLVLGCFVRLNGRSTYWFATVGIMAIGGLGTWLFSTGGMVVGASGLVFGYWSFLIVNGILKKSLLSIALSVVTLLFYGGLLFSFIHFSHYISWAGHFWGAIGGFSVAYLSNKLNK